MKKNLSKIGISDESFQLLTVGDLIKQKIIEKPLDGNHGEIHPKGDDFVENGVPFIMATDIKDGAIDYINCKFIAKKQADSLRKGFATNGDVLVTHKASIGRTAIVNHGDHPYIMLTPQVTYYRVIDANKLNNRYLKHYFDSQLFQETLQLWAGAGSTRAYLGITGQHKLPVILPALATQESVAAILSVYDDLIENNKRRIALLEKVAEEIYREWFVRFRFPGHKTVEFAKGFPKAWQRMPIEKLCKEVRQSVKKKDLEDDSLYVGLEHIPRKSIALTSFGTAAEVDSDKLCFKAGDVLFGKIRPYLHKVSLAHFSGACSTDTIVLRARRKDLDGFILFTVFSERFIELATTASKGTKMPRADWSFLGKQEILIPPNDLLERYQSVFGSCFDQIKNLLAENQLLEETKGLLLPRLISGKLSVEDLDVRIPPSMTEHNAA